MKKKISVSLLVIMLILVAVFVINKSQKPKDPFPHALSNQVLYEEDIRSIENKLSILNDNLTNRAVKEWGYSNRYRKQIGIFDGKSMEIAYECFGDICPDNGGYLLRYSGDISEEECLDLGGRQIIAYPTNYFGCGVSKVN
ncbi:MAG: hypothetical protein Q8O98_02455 [bacterium]|nr:hypothetical protein [bacterium]